MPPNPLPDTSKIVDLYVSGLSIHTVSKQTGCPYGRVREILVDAGVALRPRSASYLVGADHPSSKLSAERRETLISELFAGEKQHRQLALEYGISRERVRQIAQYEKAPPGREVQRKVADRRAEFHDAELAARREGRQQKRDERYSNWRDLWAKGLSLRQMAAALGMSPMSIGVRITELRRSNPDWFPYRREQLTPEVLQRREQERQAAKAARLAERKALRDARTAKRKADREQQRAVRALQRKEALKPESPQAEADSPALLDSAQP